MHIDSQFWAGTDESLATYLLVMKHRGTRDPATLPAQAQAFTYSGSDPEAQKPAPRLFSQSGNVGIITIAGPLVNNDSPWNQYDGIVSYNEIRDALTHAAQDASIGAIVLDVNSGGGAVSGVSDTAELIASIDKKVKPVHTFSDGMIASAAYWLGSSARSISLGKVTEAGSIGVLTIHAERSKMLADAGVNVTVIRAGTHKALGNAYEPLSPLAKATLQAQLDQMYTMFMSHVADARGVTYAAADTKMGQGRVFIGATAVEVGLADKVSSFDAVVSKAQRGIDSSKSVPQYGVNLQKGITLKTALTEQQVALLAEAGMPASDAVVAVASIATAETDAAVIEAAAVPVIEASNDLVAFLKTSLSEAQASATTLTTELRDLKAAAGPAAEDSKILRTYTEGVGNRMKIALGGSAGGSETMSAAALVAENTTLRTQYETQFKAGGLSAISSTGSSDKAVEATDPVRLARLASTRPAK